jgi:hypothetical protein
VLFARPRPRSAHRLQFPDHRGRATFPGPGGVLPTGKALLLPRKKRARPGHRFDECLSHGQIVSHRGSIRQIPPPHRGWCFVFLPLVPCLLTPLTDRRDSLCVHIAKLTGTAGASSRIFCRIFCADSPEWERGNRSSRQKSVLPDMHNDVRQIRMISILLQGNEPTRQSST